MRPDLQTGIVPPDHNSQTGSYQESVSPRNNTDRTNAQRLRSIQKAMKHPLKLQLLQTIRRSRGFTLLEILIVVMIASMLLAIAIPNFIQARETSRSKACQRTLWEIQSAKERWAMDNRRAATDTPVLTDLVVPGVYLRTSPVCPSSGTYTIGRLDETPQCSVGGAAGSRDAHVLQ